MTNELKRFGQEIFFILLLVIHCSGVRSAENEETNLNTESKVPFTALEDFSLDSICKENELCNERFICDCRPEFKVYNNECIPKAGENENCTSHEDCCGNLICIKGICRKRSNNNEFVALAKICLGITVTSIIIALFSSSLKFLLRNDSSRLFQRQNVSSRLSTTLPREMTRPENFQEIHDEKPPSYEECMRSMAPPYIISSNPMTPTTQTVPVHQPSHMPGDNPLNLTTPLNVQNLSQNLNSNLTAPKDSEVPHQISAKNS